MQTVIQQQVIHGESVGLGCVRKGRRFHNRPLLWAEPCSSKPVPSEWFDVFKFFSLTDKILPQTDKKTTQIFFIINKTNEIIKINNCILVHHNLSI